jgi:oxepin-CoA hydrolase/3-oxo-5,6-dehydrosuberyl-CoA semialdehyde dehydrogenase
MAKAFHGHRDELLDLATLNGGNTRGDGKFDVDGAIAVLAHYAELAKSQPETSWLLADEATPLFHTSKLRAQQVWTPRHGIAIHINAFNFPAWGMFGKAAVSILAGMPFLTKPATSTTLVAHRMAEILVAADILPKGAFQFLAGPVGDLLDHVGAQDVIAFTGSAATGARIRTHARVVAKGTRTNIEADSLNAVLVGPDVTAGSELFDRVLKDLETEITQKAGQKCTATRRVLVPEALLSDLQEALSERLSAVAAKTGDPRDKGTRMGPLSTAQQVADARTGIGQLREHARLVLGDPMRDTFHATTPGKGYFIEPMLLVASPEAALSPDSAFHHVEVFGPVSTLLPYDGTIATAARIVGLGEGSLVTTVYSDDRAFVGEAIVNVAPHVGRLVLTDDKHAGAALPPGGVLPTAHHGGPGRAGGGQELGGRAGLELYLQRTTLQGGAAWIGKLLG